MSIASSRPPASFRARSLALALVILLALFAGSPRMFATNSMRPIATEPASFGGPHSAHIAATIATRRCRPLRASAFRLATPVSQLSRRFRNH